MTSSAAETSTKLVVVLGTHRSGTSAIARALPVLGAEMGDKLLPPDYRNEKGYWEDQRIKSFNDKLLQHVGSRWDHISALADSDFRSLRASGFGADAAEILKEKCPEAGVYGLKEPQITKLLPFWLIAFEEAQIDYRFVMSLRNPLSSAMSLAKRDGLTRQHGYDLWFSDMVAAIRSVAGSPLIIVEYDQLLKSPGSEIRRMAQSLNLTTDSDKLAIYRDQFLDADLRHSEYGLADLAADDECPNHVQQLFAFLCEQARSSGEVDQTALLAAGQSFAAVQDQLGEDARIFDAALRKRRLKAAEFSYQRTARKLIRETIERLPGGERLIKRFRP